MMLCLSDGYLRVTSVKGTGGPREARPETTGIWVCRGIPQGYITWHGKAASDAGLLNLGREFPDAWA